MSRPRITDCLTCKKPIKQFLKQGPAKKFCDDCMRLRTLEYNRISNSKPKIILNESEKAFSEIMENQGKKLIYQPYIREFKIRPDFYCLDDDTYYEVITTRQSYHSRKEKLKKAIESGLKLKIIKPDGSPYLKNKK